MRPRKPLRIIAGLLLIFVVVAGVISVNHPIILKWLSGTARHIGRPIAATVYTDGQVNSEMKVFHVDTYWNGERADYYLLYTPSIDRGRLKFFSLDKKDNYAGLPISTNVRDYDLIAGHLFQSETGSQFFRFTDDMKGFDFDPKLTFSDKQIRLNIPPAAVELECDSIRIEF